MDLSNIITSSNYTISDSTSGRMLMNKITELTGYQWKTYFWNITDFLGPMMQSIDNFFHSWPGILLLISLLIVIGEVLFYKSIKKEKAEYGETSNNFVLKQKCLSYAKAMLLIVALSTLTFFAFFFLSFMLMNLHVLLLALVMALIYCIGIGFGCIITFKVLVFINKKLFGHLIKKETAEEYEARQTTYKFRDGTLVKVKPNIVGTEIDGHEYTEKLNRLSKKGIVCNIKRHDKKGRLDLRTATDNDGGDGPNRWECFFEAATLEETDKFNKEKEEYEKKQVLKMQGIIYKFWNWCITIQ